MCKKVGLILCAFIMLSDASHAVSIAALKKQAEAKARDAADNVRNTIPIHCQKEENFLGNPEFVIKNRENLGHCVTWEAFMKKYSNEISLFKDANGEKLYILPHYGDGSCLWHALGIGVSEVYDLMIKTGKDILENKKNLGLEDLLKGMSKDSPERAPLEEALSTLNVALSEVLDVFYPEQINQKEEQQTNELKEMIDTPELQAFHKEAWLKLIKKHGGKAFSVTDPSAKDKEVPHTLVAIRPLHSEYFFQNVADYLGVKLRIINESMDKTLIPYQINGREVPTLILHGLDHHYEPLVKENTPVPLALILDMENHLKKDLGNKLKVSKEDLVFMSYDEIKNPVDGDEEKKERSSFDPQDQGYEKQEVLLNEKSNGAEDKNKAEVLAMQKKLELAKKFFAQLKKQALEVNDRKVAEVLQLEENDRKVAEALQLEENDRKVAEALQREEDAALRPSQPPKSIEKFSSFKKH